ncbi:hypothetical protein ABBQ32_009495 [Trebouxia sp. C0010 RCD-2024]
MLAKSVRAQCCTLRKGHTVQRCHIASAAGQVRKLILCCGNMAPKRKVDQGETPDKKPRVKSAKKEKPLAEPHIDEDGWTIVPPSLLFMHAGLKPSSKIAAFDMDGTLIGTKRSATFPIDEHDWKFFNKQVPKELQAIHQKGFKIVIFSNQNAIKSALEGKMAKKIKGRVTNMLKAANIPAQILLATSKDQYRKPERGMWDYFIEHGNEGEHPDMKESYFVGDAAGRAGDHADTDKGFAANVGLPFKLPEEVFGESLIKKEAASGPSGDGVNHNAGLCMAFLALADLQNAKGGSSVFAARANKKVASILEAYPRPVTEGKELKDVKGVGKGSIEKIDEFIRTGTFAALNEAEASVQGGDALEKQTAVQGKAKDLAAKFL